MTPPPASDLAPSLQACTDCRARGWLRVNSARTQIVPGSAALVLRGLASAAPGEGLDAPRVAYECDHDRNTAEKEKPLHNDDAVGAEVEQVADGPTAGKGGAEDLRTNQDGGAQHGKHAWPRDPAVAAQPRAVVHVCAPVAVLGRVAARARCKQPGERKRGADTLDLGAGKLDQGRAHHRTRKPAEQHQRFLHAIVHVNPGIGVEGAREGIDADVESLRLAEILALHGAEQLRL